MVISEEDMRYLNERFITRSECEQRTDKTQGDIAGTTEYKDACPVRTDKCKSKTPKECRMCEYYDIEIVRADKGTTTKKANSCPNCGAPIKGDHCEYCGSQFSNPIKPAACTNETFIDHVSDMYQMAERQAARTQKALAAVAVAIMIAFACILAAWLINAQADFETIPIYQEENYERNDI